MAIFLNNDVFLTISAVDLSDHVESITINRQFDELETTAMGAAGHTFVKGLEASSITINFYNDTATGKVLQTLQAAWGANVTVVTRQVKTGGYVALTNPTYTMTCLINKTTDINGKVSDLSMQSVTWNVSGTIVIS
jgi:hypothetical protein